MNFLRTSILFLLGVACECCLFAQNENNLRDDIENRQERIERRFERFQQRRDSINERLQSRRDTIINLAKIKRDSILQKAVQDTTSFHHKVYQFSQWYKEKFAYDPNFVSRPEKKFALTLHNEAIFDLNAFQNEEYNTDIHMRSTVRYKLGLSLAYRSLSLSYYSTVNDMLDIDLDGVLTSNVTLSTSRFIAQVSYFSDDGVRFFNSVKINGKKKKDLPSSRFNGYEFHVLNAQVDYIFNHRRYAHSATHSRARIQKRSQGSFIGGFSYNRQSTFVDRSVFSEEEKKFLGIDQNTKLNMRFHDFCVDFGYGYNLSFWNGIFTTNFTLLPRIGIKYPEGEHVRLAFDPTADIAMAYNHNDWTIGLRMQARAYTDLQEKQLMSNTVFDVLFSVGRRF